MNMDYQKYLEDMKDSGVKRYFREKALKNPFYYKIYLRLTNISVKKLRVIPNIKSAEKILDIGCGTGETLEYIKNFLNPSANFFGVDLQRNRLLPEYIQYLSCNLETDKLPFESSHFDLVISNFLIEHLRNPSNLIDESFRVLKPGGYMYISTEYYTSVFSPDYWNFYSDPTHIRPWTKKALKNIVAYSGFEVYDVGVIRWWEFIPLLPFVPLLNLLTKSNFSFIPYEILGRTVYVIARKL